MATPKHNTGLKKAEKGAFQGKILGWYDRHRRDLPWRAKAGRRADPYHVWLSEIMLQQTTVTAVMPYYTKFLKRWPTVQRLAAAAQGDVMKEWAGLGYYARARNLHACAQVVTRDLKGVFPEEQGALKNLPGIGDYTSAAICAIAFNKPAVVVDGNIERVAARYFAVREPLPASKPLLKKLAGDFFDGSERPGDLAQALMDLGATICIPAKPRCVLCPVNDSCRARRAGIQDELPARTAKKARPSKMGHVYIITDAKGRVLLERRPDKGLLGGMMALPTSDWVMRKKNVAIAAPGSLAALKLADISKKPASVKHVFTHFDLELVLKTARVGKNFRAPKNHSWVEAGALESAGFPSLFKKAFKLGLQKGIIE